MEVKSLRTKIKDALDGNSYTALLLQLLIIISLITFSLETLPTLSEQSKSILTRIELITIIIFSIEYILRIITYDKPLKFIFSWWGAVDAAVLLPYYLAIGIDLRAVRIFRLFRLVRILKIFRSNDALKRITRALVLAKNELILFGGLALVILYLAAVGIYYFENQAQPANFQSIPHSLWWAVATLTTVGYGDIYPITVGGKFFTGIVVMVGLGFVAMPASILTAALSQARREEENAED